MWNTRSRVVSLFQRRDFLNVKSTVYGSTLASPSLTEDNTNVKPFEEIPTPGGIYKFPAIGNMFLFYPFTKYGPTNMHLLMDKLHEKLGKTFRLKLGDKNMVVVETPRDFETVFRNEGKYPHRGYNEKYQYYAEKNNKEKNFIILNGEDWHKFRSRVQKTFLRPSAPHGYLLAQNEVANDLVRLLAKQEHKPHELRDEFFKYAAESICVVCFDKRIGCFSDGSGTVRSENEAFVEAVKVFVEGIIDVGMIPLYKIYKTPSYKRFEDAGNRAYGFGRAALKRSLEEIHDKEKQGTLDTTKPNLLLTLLSQNTSLEEVTALILDLLVGGTDSTAKNMEFFLRCLALNPDKQELLYEEIKKVVGFGKQLTAEHIELMPYYKSCFKESMRLNFPLAVGTARILENDVVLDGYHVPKETLVAMNNNRAVHNPEYFDKPNQYIPERWQRAVDGKRKQALPSFTMLPFGFGVRNCIGRRFAEQEIWLAVVKIVQNFKVSVSEEDKDHEIFFPTFRTTKRPINFTFTPR